jgi:hypothetical protein
VAHFLPSGYKFCELYECRAVSRVSEASSGSTILIGAANLSPVTKLMADTGPEVSGVQIVSEPEICQGIGFKLLADERVRVQRPLRICLVCRSKSKKCDKQLTHIVRVISRVLFIPWFKTYPRSWFAVLF